MKKQEFGGRIDEGEGHWEPPVDHRAFNERRSGEKAAEGREREREIELGGVEGARDRQQRRNALEARKREGERLRSQREMEAREDARETADLHERVDKRMLDDAIEKTKTQGKRRRYVSKEAESTTGLRGIFLRFKEKRAIDKRNKVLDSAMWLNVKPEDLKSPAAAKKYLRDYGRREGSGYKAVYKREGASVAEKTLKSSTRVKFIDRITMLIKGDILQPKNQADLISQWDKDRLIVSQYWHNRKDGQGKRTSDREAKKAIKRLSRRRQVFFQ
jgi:hypothetical protein